MSTILVVDDDYLVLRTLEKALKINGYDVDIAESGEKALRLAESKNYETILTDLNMPKMNGLELMCQIKGECKKFFMSGYPKKYIDSGIEFLQKPFGVDQLLNFIKA